MQDLRWPTFVTRDIVLDRAAPGRDPEGRGSLHVQDTEGRVYLDAINGIGCAPLGHAHPRWTEAVAQQMGRLTGAAGPYRTEPQQKLVAEIVARCGLPEGRVFLGNTGTEVTEAAIKVALRATKRDVIIGFERAFHGRTMGALALTATPEYRDPYVSCLEEPETRFARVNIARARAGDLDHVAALFDRYAGRVAAVFVEPIQGESGIYPAKREFLVALRELCDRHGALLGTDEIQSGSGRTGNFSAWTTIVGNDPELAPDIAWYAKALGGGLPIGACVAKRALAEHMNIGSHGSTFGGNPITTAAALATLRIMDEEGLFASAGAQLPTLQRIAAARPHPLVRDVRGLGAMLAIEIAGEGSPATPLVGALQEAGVLVTVCKGTTVRLLLPYRANEQALGEFWNALTSCLERAVSPAA